MPSIKSSSLFSFILASKNMNCYIFFDLHVPLYSWTSKSSDEPPILLEEVYNAFIFMDQDTSINLYHTRLSQSVQGRESSMTEH